MKLPFFFLKILQKMSSKVKENQDHTKQCIFHHGLIKLIISTVLQKKEKTWDYFLFWSGFQFAKEDQSRKRQLNKGHNLVKKLKKKVIVEIEEDSVQGKSVTQRDENVENKQQNKVEEDEISKGQMQDLEHEEDSLHEEVNQGVDESLIEQEQVPMGVQSEDTKSPLFDEARADTVQDLQEQFEEGVMS